jgi:hypothetical protein
MSKLRAEDRAHQVQRQSANLRFGDNEIPTSALKPISSPPPLWRTNGFGVGLYGWINDHRLPVGFIKLYFLTALWIPIIPLCAYAVMRVENGFRFHNSMNLFQLLRVYKFRVVSLYATALLEGVGWLILFGGMVLLVGTGIYWLRDHLLR